MKLRKKTYVQISEMKELFSELMLREGDLPQQESA